MRLIELKDHIRGVRIPVVIFQELLAVEVDTVGPDSPEPKVMMADEFQRAQYINGIVKVPLSDSSKQYLLHHAIPNLIDIAADQMNKPLISKLQNFQSQLEAALTESVIQYRTLAVYPGRFSPPHIGHMQAWKWLEQKFGSAYIATSDKVSPPRSPLDFNEKKILMMFAGIPGNRIAQVKNPYQPTEIIEKFDASNTVLVFGVSEKDMAEDPRFNFSPKKDGSASYLQSYEKNKNNLRPLSEHGYIITTPTFNFKVLGKPMISASEFRAQFFQSDDAQQAKMIKDLYGKYNKTIHKLLKDRIVHQDQT
jgi:hypothetical protein